MSYAQTKEAIPIAGVLDLRNQNDSSLVLAFFLLLHYLQLVELMVI
jgi:hypothetical protein